MYTLSFQHDNLLTVYKNGEFDLRLADVGLYRCLPGIDGQRIHPSAIEVEKSGEKEIAICYVLDNRKMRLHFTGTVGRLSIALSLEHEHGPQSSDSLSVFEQAHLCGAEKILRHGYFSWDGSSLIKRDDVTFAESHGLTAVLGEEICAVLGFERHDRMRQEFLFDAEARQIRLSARALLEGKDLSGTTKVECSQLLIFSDDSLEEGQKKWAGLVAEAMNLPPQTRSITGWCSWYYHYYWFSGAHIEEYLDKMQPYKASLNMDYFVIDANHFTHLGDWLDTHERYPKGLQYYAQRIREQGYVPGIWVGPFMVGNLSRVYREHPDWLLRDEHGELIPYMSPLGEDAVWAYRDKAYYCLDTSHPGAMAYLHEVFTTLYDWGFRYFKTDFMYWGAMDRFEGGWFYQGVNEHNYISDRNARPKIKRYTPGKTGVEYFVDTLRTIRQAVGDESIILGCGQPLWMSIGYVDAMRISRDMGARWSGGNSPQEMIQDLALRNFANETLYQIDPDCVLLRHFEQELSDREIRSLALYMGVSQGVIMTSDPVHECTAERRELFRFIQLQEEIHFSQPLLGREEDLVLYVGHRQDSDLAVLFCFNPTHADVAKTFSLQNLKLSSERYVYEWGGKETDTEKYTEIRIALEAHDSVLFFLATTPFTSRWRPKSLSG